MFVTLKKIYISLMLFINYKLILLKSLLTKLKEKYMLTFSYMSNLCMPICNEFLELPFIKYPY